MDLAVDPDPSVPPGWGQKSTVLVRPDIAGGRARVAGQVVDPVVGHSCSVSVLIVSFNDVTMTETGQPTREPSCVSAFSTGTSCPDRGRPPPMRSSGPAP